MKTPKLNFDKDGLQVIDENNVLIFKTDIFSTEDYDCSNQVIENVVRLYNESIDNNWFEDVDEYLLDEGECTQEAREIIVESIFEYRKEHLI